MTPATMNELIDRAARIVLADDIGVYLEQYAILDDELIGKVSVADCLKLRDHCATIPTIGARMICNMMDLWAA